MSARAIAFWLAAALTLAACVAAAPAADGGGAEAAVSLAEGVSETQAEAVVETAPPPPPAPVYAAIDYPDRPFRGATQDWPQPPSPAVAPVAAGLEPVCGGAFRQGGLAVCRTAPGAQVRVGGEARGAADAQGFAVIGFDRDAPAEETIAFTANGQTVSRTFAIAALTFDTQSVSGLPQQTVTPDAAAQARIARDRVHINRGYASRADAAGYLDGFIWPVEGRISGSWGNRRVLNGTPMRPHYGIDIAAPAGTPIRAPAAGIVTAAQPDLLREGGLVMIDHGQGLISLYLHMSRLDVAEGQSVAQGDVIGAVGATGRATGAHLCWRMKWRDRYLDPSLAIYGLAEARRVLAGG